MLLGLTLLFSACTNSGEKSNDSYSGRIFEFNNASEPRWSSPENLNGVKGAGGKENNGGKGHPYDSIPAGQSKSLLDIKGQGMINRIWITINDRSPEMLRSLKIEMFWDDAQKPAVSVPFGDFFGVGLGRTTAFENVFFANAEGRSFNCFIPMPFQKAARIVVTNESDKELNNMFFDVDYQLLNSWEDDYLYFHAYWSRDTATQLAKDFELLPSVSGKGRFLGVNVGINSNPLYKESWWGEGEVKMFIDGDKEWPTLAGTGTEDYIGTAWGQGKFINRYTGCSIADDSALQWTYYRYHIPDPIYFKNDCKIAIQQLGGWGTEQVAALQQAKVPLIPVTTDDGRLHPYYSKDSVMQLNNPLLPKGWTNFYRSDDVSATAYFYLDKPSSNLPAIQPVNIRATSLRSKK
jgi:hypothetical protein